MPCRKEESFLLLEQSVTVGSKDVDALVARIGEALQLSARRAPSRCKVQPQPPQQQHHRAAPYPLSTPRGAGRLQHRTPPPPPPSTDHAASKSRSKQLPGRGWLRGARKTRPHPPGEEEEDDDPHRLLQELILSGNLIKEAVRRLQIAAFSAAAVSSPSSYSSSSGGEPGRIPQP
ncbi:GSK-3-binding protein FRAT2 [Rhinatrema bivittatum]|uniref:GSK-3-binding protein FRAT2 n=1 Tax=Rhinatrema bivittatum TaxID=194408 RepID=UPI00112B534D|nr:GSK-3-binding protein FRAT2 [Rhinatrema bivittatum]